MTLSPRLFSAGMVAGLLLTTGCATAPRPGAMASADCFSTVNWRGWSSPADDVIYLRVGLNDIYRVDLLPGSGRHLESGGQFLISEAAGSSRVCSPIDLQLSIADANGFRTPLFPQSIRKLTPEEVAAIPAGERP